MKNYNVIISINGDKYEIQEALRQLYDDIKWSDENAVRESIEGYKYDNTDIEIKETE